MVCGAHSLVRPSEGGAEDMQRKFGSQGWATSLQERARIPHSPPRILGREVLVGRVQGDSAGTRGQITGERWQRSTHDRQLALAAAACHPASQREGTGPAHGDGGF